MTVAPRIGRLRHRLTIEEPVRTGDGGGGADVTWTLVATVWGAIEPGGASQQDVAGRHVGVVTHRITIRHRDDVLGGMRIRHDGRTFRLLAAHDPDETGRWTEIQAEEKADDPSCLGAAKGAVRAVVGRYGTDEFARRITHL